MNYYMIFTKKYPFTIILIIACILSILKSAISGEIGEFISPAKRITNHPDMDKDPAVSPDGKWILFSSNRFGNWDIFVKPASGGASYRLTDELIDEHSPSWSPSGKKIAFVSSKDDALGDIWMMKINFRSVPSTGKPVKLTDYLGYDGQPMFSPEEKNVIFTSDRSGSLEIWRENIKGGKPVKLTEGGGFDPAISAKGELAFVRVDSTMPTGELFLKQKYDSADEPEQITYSNMYNFSPAFSPQNDAILVSRIARDTDGDKLITLKDNSTLWCIPLNPDSSKYKKTFQLTSDLTTFHQPSWASDGRIYFTADIDGLWDILSIPETGYYGRAENSVDQLKLVTQQTGKSSQSKLLGLESVIGYYPDSDEAAEAMYLKGIVFASQGENKVAESYFIRVMRDFSYNSYLYSMSEIGHLKVISNYETGENGSIGTVSNPAGFVIALDQILGKNPHLTAEANAKLLKANALLQMGVFSEALDIYSHIIENYQDYPDLCAEAKFHSAEIYSRYGDPAEVVEAYLTILRGYPTQEEWNRLAINRIFDLEIGDNLYSGLQKIIRKYRQYTKLTSSAHLEFARRLSANKEFELAIDEYEFAFRTPGDNPLLETVKTQAAFEISDIYHTKNEFTKAMDYLNSIYNSSRRYSGEAFKRIVKAYINRGQANKNLDRQIALASFRRVTEVAPDNLQGHRGYIETLNIMGKGDEAYQEYSNLVRQNPGNPVYLYGKGLALSYIGGSDPKKLENSSELIESALSVDHSMIPAYLTLSYNYLALEEINKSGSVKIGFTTRATRNIKNILLQFWRAITLKGEPEEFTGYEKSINILLQAIAINDETENPRIEADLYLNLGNNYYALGEYGSRNAFQAYKKMLSLDSTFVSESAKAVIFEKIGRSALYSDEYKYGRTFLESAKETYVKLGDDKSVFRILLLKAELELRAGDGETSNDYFKAALSQADIADIEVPNELFFTNIAFNWYEINEWIKAQEACSLALKEFSNVKIPRPKKKKYKIGFEFIGVPLPIGITLPVGNFAMGESRSAEGFHPADIKSLSYALLTASYFQQGEYEKSSDILKLKTELAEYKKYSDEISISYNNQGFIAYQSGQYDRAADYFLKSIEASDKQQSKLGLYKNVANLQLIVNLLSPGNNNKKNVENIINVTIAEIVGEDSDNIQKIIFKKEKAEILINRGNSHFQNAINLIEEGDIDSIMQGYSELQEAVKYWDQALTFLTGGMNSKEALMCRANIAYSAGMMGDIAYADSKLKQILDEAVAGGYSSLIWRIEFLQGSLFLLNSKSKNLETGERLLSESADELERLNPSSSEEYPTVNDQKEKLYNLLMELNRRKGDTEKAFLYAERKSAQNFMEVTAKRDFLAKTEKQKFIWSGGGGSINYLRNEMIRLKTELHKPDIKAQQKEDIGKQLKEVEDEYSTTMEEVISEDPEFASLFSVSPVALSDLQSVLRKDEVILRFAEMDDGYIVWNIAREDFYQNSIVLNPGVLSDILDSLEMYGNDSAWLDSLNKRLLTPISDALDFYGSLLIVPDGEIMRVPLERLSVRNAPLVENYRIAKGNSASYFYYSRQKRYLSKTKIVSTGIKIDSLLDSGEYKYFRGEQVKSKDDYFDLISTADICLLKADIDLNRLALLNSGFAFKNDDGQIIDIKTYELFSKELPISLMIIEDVQTEEIGWQTFLRSLCFAGIPGVITIEPGTAPEILTTYYRTLFRELPNNSNLEAHRMALKKCMEQTGDTAAVSIEFWGDGGLKPSETNEFAKQNLMTIVRKGNYNLGIRNYEWAIRYYRQALDMAKELNDARAETNLLKLILQSSYAGGDWETAVTAQNQLITPNLDEVDKAAATANLAAFSVQLGKLEDALKYADSASEMFIESGNPEKAVGNLLSFAQSLQKIGRFDMAKGIAQKAKAVQVEWELPDIAATDVFIGQIILEMDEPEEALDILTSAIDSDELAASELSFAYILQGRCLQKMLDYPGAFNNFTEAVNSAPQDSMRLRANGYQGLADISFLQGRLDESLEYLQTARKLFETTESFEEVYLSYNTEGLIFLNMGRFNLAEKSLTKALELVEKTFDRQSEANIRKNLARYFIETGQLKKALSQSRSILDIHKNIGLDIETCYDHLIIAGLKYTLGDLSGATNEVNKVSQLNADLKKTDIEIKISLLKASILAKNKKWDEALGIISSAYKKAEILDVFQLRWRISLCLGKIFEAKGLSDSAAVYYAESAGIIENNFLINPTWEVKTVFMDDYFEPFDLLIKFYVAAGLYEEAVVTSDKAKMLEMRYILSHRGVSLRKKLSYSNEESNLKSQITAFQQRLDEKKFDNADENFIRNQKDILSKMRQDYNDLIEKVQDSDPIFFEIYSNPSINVQNLKNKLNIDDAVLTYYIGRDNVFGFVVNSDTVIGKKLNISAKDLSQKTAAYRNLIEGIFNTENESKELYKLLIEPFASSISETHKLIIIGDGILNELPFDCLIDSEDKFCIDRWNIIREFSLENISLSSADNFDNIDNIRSFYAVSKTNYPNVEELEFAGKEVESIAFTFPQTHILSGDSAEVEKVVRHIEDADIIHFACHGRGDEYNGLDYALLLSPGENDNGELTVREIYGLVSKVKLVYSSACGRDIAGIFNPEPVSFPQALITAGVENAVSSLWKSDDLSAGIISKRFYRNLRDTESVSESLRMAKKYIKDEFNPHPAYWAGFQLYGNSIYNQKVQ